MIDKRPFVILFTLVGTFLLVLSLAFIFIYPQNIQITLIAIVASLLGYMKAIVLSIWGMQEEIGRIKDKIK